MANLLQTGVTGLLASQRAIATASHNIANVNTEGYSRQRVHYAPRPADASQVGYIGNGVEISGIERINNEFLQTRLQEATSDQSRVNTYYNMMSRLDVMLADDNSGLTGLQSDFFNAIQDLNTNPTSVGARQALLNSAQNLTDRFNSIQNQFDSLQSETSSRIGAVVNDINSIAENITELNVQIIQSGGNPPNDLLDQRELQLTKLSELIAVDTVTMEDGSVSVFMGNGVTLVSREQAMSIGTQTDPEQPEKVQIVVKGTTSDRVIDDQITGGSLGGLMEFRRELDASMNRLGRLSVILADQFNQQHRQGLTLEGDTGSDFFSLPEADVAAYTDNTGSASVSVDFTDTTQLTASDYILSYNGTDYTLTRTSDNESITGSAPLSMDGMQFNVSGTANSGDDFLIRPTRKAARDIGVEITQTNDIALSSKLRSEALVANLGTGEITAPDITDPDNASLTDTVEIRFTDSSTFDVVNTSTGTTLASGVTYVKGDAISHQGWSVEISGEPEAGDLFVIDMNTNGTGNNRNGQALADLQSEQLIDGTSNLLDGYGAFISQVGSATRQAQISSEAMDAMYEEAYSARENVSGVNLDEEAINLTRLQQSYQASAQIIAAAESMFQVLISAVGR